MKRIRRHVRSVLAGTIMMGGLGTVGLTAGVLGTGAAYADTGFVSYSCTVGGSVSGDFKGSIPATLTTGTAFSISGFQIVVDLTQAQVQQIETTYGVNHLSGSVDATIKAVGATPSSLTQNVGTFSVNLPNPPAPVSFPIPSSPISLGNFTATSSSVIVTTGATALVLSNIGVTSNCSPPTPAPVLATTTVTGPFTFVGNGGDGTVTVLNTSTGAVVGAPINVGGTPDYIAVTPDGSKALVSTWPGGNSLVPIDTATLTAGAPIPIQAPRGMAITPDGATAWVTGGSSDDTLYPVNLATDTIGTPVVVDPSGSAASVAISPDGSTAYVASQFTGLIPVNLATESVGATITLPNTPSEVNITPNGATVWVTGGQNFIPIDVTQHPPVVGTPISMCSAGSTPDRFAITPDGATAYVGCFNTGFVEPVTLATSSVGTPIAVGSSTDQIIGVSISPDGSTVYAADATANEVFPIQTASATAGSPTTVGSSPQGIGIMPDVGPAASLSVSQNQSDSSGLTEDFDAGASVSNTSPIVSYAWTFGDGGTDVTTTATDSHKYASSGSYTATVTVTDAAGTSTTEVTTGQSILRNGSSSATASAQFTLSSCSTGCTPTVSSPDNNATVAVTQATSTQGSLTLSVAPAVLACAGGFHHRAEVSTLTESSAFSSSSSIQVQVNEKHLAGTKGVKICYQSGGPAPPPPLFLPKCKSPTSTKCYVSLATSGPDSVVATLHIPPGDPRFWVGCGSLGLTTLTPPKGSVGATLTIKGKNLSQVANVLFSTAIPGKFIAAAAVQVKSITQVKATVPTGASTGPIEVTTDLNTYLSTKVFTVK